MSTHAPGTVGGEPADAPPVRPPSPRRTRAGAVVVGPTVGARYLPGVLMGLPLVSLLLSPFAGAGIQEWRRSRLADGHRGALEDLLSHAPVQLLLGALALWALFALWALVPLIATHQVALLDETSGRLTFRRGLRTADTADLADVLLAVGGPERGDSAGIDLRGDRQWIVPGIGWDDRSFDGLRVLQEAAGLLVAPDREQLVAGARHARRTALNRQYAERLGMPWREEYEHDEAAFQQEFDRIRRVLGGRESARPGDPTP
ncbi:hypothetical protein ACXET9_02365 [Brachybacterium sp. DNPG3]